MYSFWNPDKTTNEDKDFEVVDSSDEDREERPEVGCQPYARSLLLPRRRLFLNTNRIGVLPAAAAHAGIQAHDSKWRLGVVYRGERRWLID
eukprot:COSAG02_NODE_240_length_27672_cov_67.291445_17_plen_91_part_00